MTPDPTLEALIAGGHYAIAADRYEEETGDAELAALMRIDGLEWELVNGVPTLRMEIESMYDDGRCCWWNIRCGKFDFGTVPSAPLDGVRDSIPLTDTPIPSILASAGLATRFTERLYSVYKDAVSQVCG